MIHGFRCPQTPGYPCESPSSDASQLRTYRWAISWLYKRCELMRKSLDRRRSIGRIPRRSVTNQIRVALATRGTGAGEQAGRDRLASLPVALRPLVAAQHRQQVVGATQNVSNYPAFNYTTRRTALFTNSAWAAAAWTVAMMPAASRRRSASISLRSPCSIQRSGTPRRWT